VKESIAKKMMKAPEKIAGSQPKIGEEERI